MKWEENVGRWNEYDRSNESNGTDAGEDIRGNRNSYLFDVCMCV